MKLISKKYCYLVLVSIASLLTGCATTQPEDISKLKTEESLDIEISEALPVKIAYHFPYKLYFDHITINQSGQPFRHNVGFNLNKSLEFVVPAFFKEASYVKHNDDFSYLFTFDSNISSEYKGLKFEYTATLTMRAINSSGTEIFSSSSDGKTTALGVADNQAIINAYSIAAKKNIIKFINANPQVNSNSLAQTTLDTLDIKSVLRLKNLPLLDQAFT